MIMWTLEEGIKFIQNLDPLMRSQFECFTALTGSVLHRGSSKKDLDVVILPLDPDKLNTARLVDYIKFMFPVPVIHTSSTKITMLDNDDYSREVIKGMHGGKLIDFFIIHEVENKKNQNAKSL